jgi:hypothetical protein
MVVHVEGKWYQFRAIMEGEFAKKWFQNNALNWGVIGTCSFFEYVQFTIFFHGRYQKDDNYVTILRLRVSIQ